MIPTPGNHTFVEDTCKDLALDAATSMKLNADCTVAVATDVFWNEDMTTCPRGCKVQLLGEGGVALYGSYDGKEKFFKKWAPVPRNRPVQK